MPLVVSRDSSQNFTPAPPGAHPGVLVDVVDLGLQEVTFQGKTKIQPKCKLVWEIEAKQENGKPFLTQKRYTLSLFDRAALYKDLKAWRGGKEFSEEELKGFDLERLIGVPCLLFIAHEERDGKTYANVTAISKPGAVKLTPSGTYIREQDRPGYQPPKRQQPQPAAQKPTATPEGVAPGESAAPAQDDSPLF